MNPYGHGGGTGVVAYESGPGWIRCEFVDGSIYLYDAARPGAHHVVQMQELATLGSGLTTYINQHVRDNYARRER